VKVAYLSHQLPGSETDDNGPRMLPGRYAGGAERIAERRIQAAPKGIELKVYRPESWEQTLDSDLIIVAATDLLTHTALMTLATRNSVVAVAHSQNQSPANKTLFESAKIFIGLSPAHTEESTNWCNVKRADWAMTPLIPSDYWIEEKENIALHAARDDYYKGKENAIQWAQDNGIPLTIMHREPHLEVRKAMAKSKYFVHLPRSFDAEPGAVIEACLSGCDLVLNQNVGFTSVPFFADREAVSEATANAANKFWELALS
jgi:hypothetical protein